MNCKQIAALMLSAAMLLPVFTACGKTGGNTADETGKTDAGMPERYTEESGYELPVNDYKGATCCFCNGGESAIDAEEETGEGLNDAIYRRNAKVEELYNVDLQFPPLPFENGYYAWNEFLNKTLMSGDDAYQVILAYSHWMAADTLTNKYYQNLLDLPYLDLTQPWWTGEFMKKANLGGALYVTVGSVDAGYCEQTYAMLFNKELADELRLTDLYQTVSEGHWTLDKLKTYTNMAAMDLDGDGEIREDTDRLGLVIQRNSPLDAFVMAFDVELTGYDADGLPYLLDLSDHYVDVQTTMNEFIVKNPNTYYAHDPGTMEFLEGRALFEGTNLKRAVEYRAMDNDFGILPYPKWDEEQPDYSTYCDVGDISSFSIPITTKGDMPANILEALAYFGYKIIVPAYYDKTLKGKTVRDVESKEMIDLIFDNITYDFTQIYGHYFYINTNVPDPSLLLRTTLFDGKSLVTEWAKKKRVYVQKWAEMLEKLS